MPSKIQGQWFRNDLLLQFKPEGKCYVLIGSDHANAFRAFYKRRLNNG